MTKKVLVGFSGNAEVAFRGVDLEALLTEQKTLIAPEDTTWGIGGTSVNLAIGFKRLARDIQCRALITVGRKTDQPREELQEQLTNLEVDYHPLPWRKASNWAATLLDPERGSRILGVKHPYVTLPVDEIYRLTRQFSPDMVVASGVVPEDAPLAQAMFNVAREINATRVFNPRLELIKSEDRELFQTLLQSTDLLIINDAEAAELLQRERWDPNEAILLTLLHGMGINEIVVTLGRNGAFYSAASGETFSQPAVECGDPVDHTGAGDSFTSGFLKTRLEGGSVSDAMRYAATTAGIKVTRHHGSSVPNHDEVAARLGQ